MNTKKCARCKQEKSVNEFSARKSNPDGLWNYCQDCDHERRSGKPSTSKRYQRQVNNSRTMAKFYKVSVDTLTSQQWLTMLNESGGKCHYCNEIVSVDELVPDHVIPLSRGGDNSIENIVPSCAFCNHSKLHRSRPMRENIQNARYAAKKLDGHLKLETQYQRHWWKRLIESLLSEVK